MPLYKRERDPNKLAYKSGDVVILSFKERTPNGKTEIAKVLEQCPAIIIDIMEKHILSSAYDGMETESYYLYRAISGSTIIEITDEDILE